MIDTTKIKEDAIFLKHNGKNCSQAVLLALKDNLKLDENTLTIIGSGFGQGMGAMKANCGALIGAVIAAGILNDTNLATKFLAKDMLDSFNNMCGSIDCHTLKGIETKKVLCSCDDCIRNAIDILFLTLEKYKK